MPELPRGFACPHFMRSAARGKLVAEALTEKWRTAAHIAKALGEDPEAVRYQLVKLIATHEAERLVRPGEHGNRYFYRAAR